VDTEMKLGAIASFCREGLFVDHTSRPSMWARRCGSWFLMDVNNRQRDSVQVFALIWMKLGSVDLP